ncbi:MAG: hypothetical protein PHG85_01190 [Candidatus Altiarchaeota archaeon]|nr:hypothetical protein [Candidatus Altiarchaeota archaeon]
MDKRTKRYFSFGIVIALIIAVGFIGYNYRASGYLSLATVVYILCGTSIGIVASYLMYKSYFQREKEMGFAPEEQVILRRKYPEKSLIIPQVIGKIGVQEDTPMEVNLYLTNIGIVAEQPGAGEPVLYIPFNDIHEMKTIRRMLLKYIQMRYTDINNRMAEILLYVGNDTETWARHIGSMLVG